MKGLVRLARDVHVINHVVSRDSVIKAQKLKMQSQWHRWFAAFLLGAVFEIVRQNESGPQPHRIHQHYAVKSASLHAGRILILKREMKPC